MNFEKNRVNPGAFDSKKLLDELLNDIAAKYNIDKSTAEKLVKNESINNLQELKQEIISKQYDDLRDIKEDKLKELFFTLKGAKEVIEKAISGNLELLKKELDSPVRIEEFQKEIEKYLPTKLILAARSPQNIHEQILGVALGTASSIGQTALVLYQIGKGIIQTPYHLYLIVKGEGSYNKIKSV